MKTYIRKVQTPTNSLLHSKYHLTTQMSWCSVGSGISLPFIEHWQLWNNLPTATSSVLLHEIHSSCHLQHANHPPVATERAKRPGVFSFLFFSLPPNVMKARTLASGAPSETTRSLQFPTHTFNLLALMQMLLRAKKKKKIAAFSLCELNLPL